MSNTTNNPANLIVSRAFCFPGLNFADQFTPATYVNVPNPVFFGTPGQYTDTNAFCFLDGVAKDNTRNGYGQPLSIEVNESPSTDYNVIPHNPYSSGYGECWKYLP